MNYQYQNSNLQTPMVNLQVQQQPMFMQPPAQQVIVVQQQAQKAEPLKTFYKGLCSCFENCDTCLIGYFGAECCALQFMHAYAVQKATEGRQGCVVPCILECLGCCCLNRQTIRNEYQIVGSCFEDCLILFFCPFCAYLQDINEVNYRIANNLR